MSDGIWNPLGITEFGINKQHIVNGKVAKTTSENIMLSGTVNHTAELNKIRAVLMSPNGANIEVYLFLQNVIVCTVIKILRYILTERKATE